MVYPKVREVSMGTSPHARGEVELYGAAAVEQTVKFFGAEALNNHAVLVTPQAEQAGEAVMQHLAELEQQPVEEYEYAQAA